MRGGRGGPLRPKNGSSFSADELSIRYVFASIVWHLVFADELDGVGGVLDASSNPIRQPTKFVRQGQVPGFFVQWMTHELSVV